MKAFIDSRRPPSEARRLLQFHIQRIINTTLYFLQAVSQSEAMALQPVYIRHVYPMGYEKTFGLFQKSVWSMRVIPPLRPSRFFDPHPRPWIITPAYVEKCREEELSVRDSHLDIYNKNKKEYIIYIYIIFLISPLQKI